MPTARAVHKGQERGLGWTAVRGVAVLAIILLAGCVEPPHREPEPHMDPDFELLRGLEVLATFPELRFETDHGTIRMVLYADWTPQTAAHVGALAQDGFYDGTIIHRIVDDFVIQGGDPTGTGEGGSGPLGTPDPVPLEIREGLDFGSGAVGLARWTDDTGDSQWFITEKPALHLSRPTGATGDVFGAYSLFGQVFAGLDVVQKIAAVETVPQLDRPVEDVVLRQAQLLPPPADADLIGLVGDVGPGVAWAGGTGELEHPRTILAGHPFTLRFSRDGPCTEAELPVTLLPEDGVEVRAHLHVTPDDPCTWEARLSVPDPGRVDVVPSHDGGQGVATLDVRGWHPAFERYAGAS